jgi:hypothetical protein
MVGDDDLLPLANELEVTTEVVPQLSHACFHAAIMAPSAAGEHATEVTLFRSAASGR